MRQSKAEIYLHIVWTTLRREPFLKPDVERVVYRCLLQEASRLGCEVVAIGGTADHVHLAVKLPTRLSVAKLMNQVKGVSSRFVHDSLSDCDGFAWQEGYGVFSIGHNQIRPVADYILNQKQHHADGSTHARWEETDEEYSEKALTIVLSFFPPTGRLALRPLDLPFTAGTSSPPSSPGLGRGGLFARRTERKVSKVYKVGVAAMVHDHVWDELRHWKSLPNVTLVAAADINAPLRERAHGEYGMRPYEDWREMLAQEELDIVQIGAENNAGAEIVEACAERGIHVVSEKPMAATLAQADRMLAAAREAGTVLLINWPTAWAPAYQEWKRRVEGGEIGPLNYLRYRAAHNGPKEIGASPYFWGWLYDAEKNGAGALMDYCCYAADMAACLLGRPDAVTGIRGVLVKDYPVPDDNAILLMQYPHAFAVAEASWTQVLSHADRDNPIAYGTGGALSISGDTVILQRPGEPLETITPPALAAPYRHAPEYLLHCLETGQPVEGFCSPQVSRDAQEILEAGLRAADTGRAVPLPPAG